MAKKQITQFGRKLEILMIKRGMNPSEFARKIGILPTNMCQLKRTRRPSPKTIYRAAQVLDVDVEYFLPGER